MGIEMSRAGKSHLPVLLLLLGITMLIVGVFKPSEAPRPKTEAELLDSWRIDAYIAGQDFVARRLKYPLTAEFPCVGNAHTQVTGRGTFLTTSYVDAKNGFGVPIRIPYICEVAYERGPARWRLINLTLRGDLQPPPRTNTTKPQPQIQHAQPRWVSGHFTALEYRHHYRLKAGTISLHRKPNKKSDIIALIGESDTFTVHNETSFSGHHWWLVETSGQPAGWLPDTQLALVKLDQEAR